MRKEKKKNRKIIRLDGDTVMAIWTFAVAVGCALLLIAETIRAVIRILV